MTLHKAQDAFSGSLPRKPLISLSSMSTRTVDVSTRSVTSQETTQDERLVEKKRMTKPTLIRFSYSQSNKYIAIVYVVHM